MKITMNMDILAADLESRTLSGRIVPFEEIGTPNIGQTLFKAGSINLPEAKDLRLNVEHDRGRPIGRALSVEAKADGIHAVFKVIATNAGDDILLEAAEGLRDGFSIEATMLEAEKIDGVTHITAANLTEVAVVTRPAFQSASITEIAACEQEVSESSTDEAESPTQENPMDDIQTPADAPVVEASAPTLGAQIFTAPRSPINSDQTYLEHKIKASLGDEDSRQYIRAADDSTSTNTGLTIPGSGRAMITTNFEGRPAIDAVSRQALDATGMSFIIPVAGTLPTVAETSEGSAPSETGMTSTYQTVTVKKYAGLNRVSFELLDRSTPAFYDELLRQLRYAYAKATDVAMVAALTASGTQATAVAATAAGLQSFIATESAAGFKGSGHYVRNLIASTDSWASYMNYADSTGRPLYFANNPSNNPGAVTGNSVVGNVLDKALYVDPFITTSGVIDESSFLVAPEAVTFYEGPATQLRVNVLTTGEVEIEMYAYAAINVAKPLGVRRFNLS
jgi:HK97 family phage major capsid protein